MSRTRLALACIGLSLIILVAWVFALLSAAVPLGAVPVGPLVAGLVALGGLFNALSVRTNRGLMPSLLALAAFLEMVLCGLIALI